MSDHGAQAGSVRLESEPAGGLVEGEAARAGVSWGVEPGPGPGGSEVILIDLCCSEGKLSPEEGDWVTASRAGQGLGPLSPRLSRCAAGPAWALHAADVWGGKTNLQSWGPGRGECYEPPMGSSWQSGQEGCWEEVAECELRLVRRPEGGRPSRWRDPWERRQVVGGA